MPRFRGMKFLLSAATTISLCPLLLDASAIALEAECPVFFNDIRPCSPLPPKTFITTAIAEEIHNGDSRRPDLGVLSELLNSVVIMQDEYFTAWLGTWPTSIDWTGAVMGTHISGALRSFSEALALLDSSADSVEDWKLKENLIENYFSQITAYYFGENAFEIRQEAYDDILWVVLGWLEATRFIHDHTELHYTLRTQDAVLQVQTSDTVGSLLRNQSWHGNLWVPAFSHRARIFWDLAQKGWDTKLCGGGMTWNPRLLPYKNAITNELFIAASISMYLYFPGDDNTSPFSIKPGGKDSGEFDATSFPVPRDPKFLKAAIDGYKWLISSNMTNTQGLYTDGFHISGFSDPGNNNTKCDERNNMVFTYNQGVLLTGQRGLWEATGAISYLTDGHQLIQNVINATGYNLKRDRPWEDYSADTIPKWHGLGRLGVMEDNCDASGTCSQDGQTFKGIFFHHLTYFCAPLTAPTPETGLNADSKSFEAVQKSHDKACAGYGSWLKWNAEAALATRDEDGVFGMWWTAGLLTKSFTGTWPSMVDDGIDHQSAGIDYRNHGVPNDTTWRVTPPDNILDPGKKMPIDFPVSTLDKEEEEEEAEVQQMPLKGGEDSRRTELRKREVPPTRDPNKRGRGRTVETQGSGLALVRAYWNIAQLPR